MHRDPADLAVLIDDFSLARDFLEDAGAAVFEEFDNQEHHTLIGLLATPMK